MAKGGKRDIMAGYSKVFAKMFYKDSTSLQMQTQTDADITNVELFQASGIAAQTLMQQTHRAFGTTVINEHSGLVGSL